MTARNLCIAMSLGLLGCGFPGADGPGECYLTIARSGFADATVLSVTAENALGGFATYQWQVELDGQSVPVVALDEDGVRIQIDASDAGVYTASVSGHVGDESCIGDTTRFNQLVDGAIRADYFLRVKVGDYPAEAVPVEALGGANYDFGSRSFSAPVPRVLAVMDFAGAPVQGYIRATHIVGSGLAAMLEGASDASGVATMPMQAYNAYDFLVVPDDPLLAPFRRRGTPGGAIQALEPVTVSGTVLNPSGTPLSGVTVRLRVDGVPSTSSVTAGNGSYSVLVQPGGGLEVIVLPPPTSGLPDLHGISAEDISSNSSLDIGFDPGIAVASITADVVDSAGAPAANALTTWVADWERAGSLVVGGGSPMEMTGRYRREFQANGSGTLAAVAVPASPDYRVLVQTASSAAVVAVDSDSPPSQLAVAAKVELRMRFVDSDSLPVAAAVVRVQPVASFANTVDASAVTETDADGSAAVQVLPGADYEITVLAGDQPRYARTRFAVQAPSSGGADLGDMALQPGIRLGGRVDLNGFLDAGTYISLHCFTCSEADRQRPLAESKLAAGQEEVQVIVPDPGVN